jgi:hypothetical protein
MIQGCDIRQKRHRDEVPAEARETGASNYSRDYPFRGPPSLVRWHQIVDPIGWA